MRAAIIAMMILLLPAALYAIPPTMGIYFTVSGYQMSYKPMVPADQFTGYVYVRNTNCSLSMAEFGIELPPSLFILGEPILPPGATFSFGSLPAGIAIGYYPPLDGWADYGLIVTLNFMVMDFCHEYGGTLADTPVRIVGHNLSGLVQGVCWEGDVLFQYIGLTSTLCPEVVGVQDTNWGAIKSLF